MNNEIYLQNTNKGVKMGVAKLTALLAGALNIFIYFFAFIANLDSVKSTILFIVAMIMSMYRFYRWAINSWQNKRLKDLAIREREIEIMRLQNDENERNINILKDELSLRITGMTDEERLRKNKKD